MRERVDHWGDLTAEPGGTDYLETEVAGLRALWAVPKGSAEDRVLLSLHGGGFVSGSIYTHRKLYGHLAKAVGARALLTDYRQSPGTPILRHSKTRPPRTAGCSSRASTPTTSRSSATRLAAGWPSPRCCAPATPGCPAGGRGC